jgi:hypothetical protein
MLDAENEESFVETLANYVDAVRDEVAEPLHAQLTALNEQHQETRNIIVDETVRLRALAEKDLDVEEERSFLATLDAKRLSLHFSRALKNAQIKEPVTTDDQPPKSDDNEFMPKDE